MSIRKGIILAGGSGSRLRPLTDFFCKQLLPVYDKPMIYYPLSTLMLLGIKDILIISTPKDTPILEAAIGSGAHLGINITYAVQEQPRGLADAFIIAEDFIGNDAVCLMLGDNILHMASIGCEFADCRNLIKGAYIIGIPSTEPHRFGVIEYDEHKRVISLEEKPLNPKSDMVSIGLYFYDRTVVQKAKNLKPSDRGELEITEINNMYLKEGNLRCKFLSRGSTWMDAGVFDSIVDAGVYMSIVEEHLGLKIGCIEEVAYMMDNITLDELCILSEKYCNSTYGDYLKTLCTKPFLRK
ncbi:glucose-1-phosphate thymidylyltransferase RfbA [Runella aurantiaca]|uniref:Glucose-1-phosphate thymidylyltransferase n=1 Tax=Runella aurantiaca TaxID=2282308 RepID=A0A369IDR4_9BACT|nr:glucose-1-phosphate thymidylyltransferase RfbA [Runella aurantiaca]RDB07818.1 glucose-1-phosphate thymidylyltransferase [Runella aurantiaca]